MMNRKLALINYLKEGGFTQEEIKEGNDSCIFLIQGEYMVLNEKERNEKVKERIQETLWAFRPPFLAEETGLPEKVFHALALTEQCEGGNDTILALIEKTCGLDAFVKATIKADGYGSFLSSDRKEKRVSVKGEDYFIYRIN